MPPKSEFRSIETGNPILTGGFTWEVSTSSILGLVQTGSLEGGGYLNTNETGMSSIKIGLLNAGRFMVGGNISPTQWYYKVPASAGSWTQITALSTSITSASCFDIFAVSAPETSQTFDLGILPTTGQKGYVIGQVFRIYFEY